MMQPQELAPIMELAHRVEARNLTSKQDMNEWVSKLGKNKSMGAHPSVGLMLFSSTSKGAAATVKPSGRSNIVPLKFTMLSELQARREIDCALVLTKRNWLSSNVSIQSSTF